MVKITEKYTDAAVLIFDILTVDGHFSLDVKFNNLTYLELYKTVSNT